ncbi:MAG: hypothetical protein M1829_003113 [Trizodia sp. TS-e1964]|nr:MAG: hypothetical protein M1829_003113 [Trizodia sp. TS-e1964]
MDVLQDYIPALQTLLSTTTSTLYPLYNLLTHQKFYAPLASFLTSMLSISQEALAKAFNSQPDLTALALLLVILLVSLKLFNMLRRALMFWTRLAAKLAFWAGTLALVVVLLRLGTSDILSGLYQAAGWAYTISKMGAKDEKPNWWAREKGGQAWGIGVLGQAADRRVLAEQWRW